MKLLNNKKFQLENLKKEDLNGENAIQIALLIQQLKGVDDDDLEEADTSTIPVTRRQTIHNIHRNINTTNKPINDLGEAFKRRLTKIQSKYLITFSTRIYIICTLFNGYQRIICRIFHYSSGSNLCMYET